MIILIKIDLLLLHQSLHILLNTYKSNADSSIKSTKDKKIYCFLLISQINNNKIESNLIPSFTYSNNESNYEFNNDDDFLEPQYDYEFFSNLRSKISVPKADIKSVTKETKVNSLNSQFKFSYNKRNQNQQNREMKTKATQTIKSDLESGPTKYKPHRNKSALNSAKRRIKDDDDESKNQYEIMTSLVKY